MRAIEYGLLNNGNYSYKDIRQNIYAFNEKIIVSNEENSQEQAPYTEIVYAQVEEIQEESNSFKIIKEGQIIDIIEGNYLLNSDAVTVSEISETATVHLNISSITAPVYKFGEAFFALITRVNIDDIEWSFLLENVEVPQAFFQRKRKREKITLLNDLLDEQKLSVIVYVSTDGALLETAYQAIGSLYPNEIVLFIETNDKANMFGSVVRIKTGENVDSTSGVPYKKLSKIVDYFNAKIDSSSLLEIIKEHVIDKSSNLFLVKKTLWGVFDKVVTLSSGLALETIQTVSEGIAEVINVFKIDDSRWMYYDEQGKPLKEHNLFLPGIENIVALQEANKSHPQLDTSKTNSEAIKKITALENALKSQRKNLGKATFFKKIIDQQLNMLSKVKDFLRDPLQQQLEAVETSFVIYNAFIVGLINSIVDAIKGIFDIIALICQGLIALKDKAIDMAQNLTSYFSLLFEMIENQIETIAHIFSKENLNALFAFFKKCGILALTLPAKLFSWITEGVEMPNLDKIAYYMGYIIGFIIQLILEILFTGGAKTVADAFAKLAESLMAVFKTLKSVAFKLKKGAVIAFENLLGILAYIREKSKNLKTFLEELWEIIQGWFKKGKADEVLERIGSGGILKYLEVVSRNVVAQEHNMSCAAACIRQIAKDYGLELEESIIREFARTTRQTGTFPDGILDGLKKVFKNKEIEAGIFYNPKISDIDMARSISKEGSWISIVRPNGGNSHAIIVDKIKDGKVFIRDPWPIEGIGNGNGVEAILTETEFATIWAQGGNYVFKVK